MGYFSPLEKCARSGAWGAWSPLGADADYVGESGLCVVYRAAAHYEAADTGIKALSLSTNFVNPNSSGNPSTACCYLYSFDPTQGGRAEVDAPPEGYIAAASVSFSASNVGSYLTFSFGAISAKPAALYFWFTSRVGYAQFGSNQIYHYATGNYSPALATGTRTPALVGGLTYSGAAGTGGTGGSAEMPVERFSIKDCGSASNLAQSRKSFTLSMGHGQVGRLRLSTGYSAQAGLIVTCSPGGGMPSTLWISDAAEIDPDTGCPVSILHEYDADGSDTGVTLEKGREYYVFARHCGAALAGSVTFTLDPPTPRWSVGDSGEYKMLSAEATRRISLAPGRYSAIRLSFAHPGTAIMYTVDTKIGETQWLEGYLDESDALDSVEGTMDSALAHDAAELGGARVDWRIEYPVQAGREYVLITKSQSPDDAQFSTTLHLIPPDAPTGGYVMDYAPDEHDIGAECAYTNIYGRYTVIQRTLDFRYRGTAKLAAAAAGAPETPQLRMYLCAQEGIDLETGIPTATPLAAAGNGAAQAQLSYAVTDGVTYQLYVVVDEVLCGEFAQLAMKISPPPAKYFKITETASYADIAAARTHSASPGQGGVSRLEMSFQKSGMVRITAEDAAGQIRCLKGAISMGADIDPLSGAPTGLILAAGSGNTEKKEYSLSFFAQAGETYYLFSRDVWVYGSASFVISITPQSGQARICVGGRLVGARAYIYSSGAWRAVQPLCHVNGAWHTGA